MLYSQMNKEQLSAEKSSLDAQYAELLTKGLKLDMSRGKPDASQLDLSTELLNALKTEKDCYAENGLDCRNYGVLDGIPEAKRLFAELLDVPTDNVMVCGASSLNIMYDEISRAMLFGVVGGEKPWGAQGKIKFLVHACYRENSDKLVFPCVVNDSVTGAFLGITYDTPLHKVVNILEMIVKRHSAYIAILCNIGNGYFGERFFLNKLFERILHYIFCDVWHFVASVLALRAGCSVFLIL